MAAALSGYAAFPAFHAIFSGFAELSAGPAPAQRPVAGSAAPLPVPTASFLPWEEAMAQAAAVIIPERRRCCARLAQEAQKRYLSISGRDGEVFTLSYECCLSQEDNLREHVLSELDRSRTEDVRRGGTGFGPHREDLALYIQGKDMRLFASQGQMRTAALAMKLSELSVFQQMAGEPPVLLLDDVMSELGSEPANQAAGRNTRRADVDYLYG